MLCYKCFVRLSRGRPKERCNVCPAIAADTLTARKNKALALMVKSDGLVIYPPMPKDDEEERRRISHNKYRRARALRDRILAQK